MGNQAQTNDLQIASDSATLNLQPRQPPDSIRFLILHLSRSRFVFIFRLLFCVPQAWQERIRQAVTDYHKMQKLIEEVSELEWKRLQERKR